MLPFLLNIYSYRCSAFCLQTWSNIFSTNFNLYTVSFIGKKKRTLILMSYLCFKGRMMEKICFGWINNCPEKGQAYRPRVKCAEGIINLTLA